MWCLVGFVAGVLMTVREWYKGEDITVEDFLWLIPFALLGVITLIVASGIAIQEEGYVQRVIISGRRK
jgi:hypothetical protein